jgi:trigger factor
VDVQVSKLGPCEAEVRLTVPSQEFEARYRRGLETASRQVRVKGFRPGKVPGAMVEKMVGEAVRRDTLEQFLREAYTQALEEQQLKPAVHPNINVDTLPKGTDFSHAFKLPLKPEFTLGTIRGIEIQAQSVAIAEGELEKTIEDVRLQQAYPEPAGDSGLPADGMGVAKLTLTAGETVLTEREGVRVQPGSAPKGIDAAAWKDALTGKQSGAVLELPIVFPEDFPRAEVRGQTGQAKIELTQAYALKKPSDEDLFKLFGVEDRPGLESKVKEHLENSKAEQERQRQESQLMEKLIELHPMPLPESLLESQIQARQAQARQQLEQSGVSAEEAEQQVLADAAPTRAAAEKSLRALFLVERVGEQERLQVAQQDMVTELRQIALRNRAKFDEVRDYYQKNNLMQQLSVELLERKVRAFLREHATIRPA